MRTARSTRKEGRAHSARSLLDFYDAYTALNARILFVLRALASLSASGEGEDERVVTGAIFSIQDLTDGMLELERRLKEIHNLTK